jgi:hypothetical protein
VVRTKVPRVVVEIANWPVEVSGEDAVALVIGVYALVMVSKRAGRMSLGWAIVWPAGAVDGALYLARFALG